MSWIKLQTNIWDNPKIDYLTHEVGLPLEMVVGIVSRLWSWFDQYTEDGKTDKIGKAKVNRIIVTSVTQLRDKCNNMDSSSVTERFIECLMFIGWIAENDQGGYTLPKWGEHNGATAKKRASDQKRQEKHRDTKTKNDDVTGVTQERDASVTREEKRREEKRRENPLSNDLDLNRNSSEIPFGAEEVGGHSFGRTNQNIPSLTEFLNYANVNTGFHSLGLSEDQWKEIWNYGNGVEWRTMEGVPISDWKRWALSQGRRLKDKKSNQTDLDWLLERRGIKA